MGNFAHAGAHRMQITENRGLYWRWTCLTCGYFTDRPKWQTPNNDMDHNPVVTDGSKDYTLDDDAYDSTDSVDFTVNHYTFN
jgi:hypothetical protein